MKKNRLYTVNAWNKNLFPDGGVPTSSVNPPTGSTNWNGYSSGAAIQNMGGQSPQADTVSSQSSGGSDFMSQMGGMDGMMQMGQQADNMMTQLGGLMANGRSSTTGEVFNTMGKMGVPGMGFVGGVVNAAFGTKWNDDNIKDFNRQRDAYNKATFGANSNEDVLSNFSMAEDLKDVTGKDVGKDGWFSHKARNRAASINEERSRANTHKQAALIQSALDFDANRDNSLLANFSAQGGPVRRFDMGGMSSFGDWWNNQGKTQYFGAFGDAKGSNQARIERQQGYNTGASSQFGGADNAMAYMSAAKSILGDISNWKNEEYVDSTLGSNAGQAAGTIFAVANMIADKHKADRPTLEDKIGLAQGGPVNKFAFGGSDYAQIAASAVKLANNAATQADTKDISGINNQIQRRGNSTFMGNSNSDLISSWGNQRMYNSEGLSNYDLRNKTVAEDVINGAQATVEGAYTGFQVGGAPGAIVGAIVGLGSSAGGTMIGRHNANKKKLELENTISNANQRQINTLDIMGNNVDRSNDMRARSLDFAFGGPYSTQNPTILMMPKPHSSSSGAINYQMASDLLNLEASKESPKSQRTASNRSKTFEKGGYIPGESYEVSEDELNRLIDAGYQIQYE